MSQRRVYFTIAQNFYFKIRREHQNICYERRAYESVDVRSLFWFIQGVTEMQVQNWTMPIKTKNKTFHKNDKKRLTA